MKKTKYYFLITALLCTQIIWAQQTAPRPNPLPFYALVENYNYISRHYPERWSRIYTEMTKMHKRNEHQRAIEGKCGKDAFWKIDTSGYKIIISGTGEMDYSYFDHNWFTGIYYWYVESVEIKEGITSVCEAAFENLKIQKVILGSSVKKISNHAFSYCLLLSEIKGMENISFIGDSALAYTGAIHNLNLSSIEKIGFGAFKNSRIADIALGDKLKITGKETFYGCANLRIVQIQGSLKKIEDKTFESCYNLKNIQLPLKLQIIGKDAFWGCEELEEITLPNTVKEIEEGAFYNNAKLKKINLPDKIKEISNSCFYCCFALSNIEIPKGVTKLGKQAFANTSLESIIVPEGVGEIGEECFYLCDLMLQIELPSTITTIGRNAFESMLLLQKVKVPCKAQDNYRAMEAMADLKDKIFCNEN